METGSNNHEGLLHDIASTPVAESKELSLQEIFDKVYVDEDIIIEIDAIEETRVRKGLSSIKAKRNAKLKDNNLPTEDSTLEFVKHADPELPKERIRLQIYMKKKATVIVHRMQVAEGL